MGYKRLRKQWKARSPEVGRWLKRHRHKTKAGGAMDDEMRCPGALWQNGTRDENPDGFYYDLKDKEQDRADVPRRSGSRAGDGVRVRSVPAVRRER